MGQDKSQWLFLRGLARESGHWGSFPQSFANTLGAEVRTLDLPGTGAFRQKPSPVSVPGIVDFLRQRAADQGWLKSPTHILAVSLGGMVALDWLSRHPEDFKAGVIINSSLSGLSPFYRRLRWQIYADFLKTVAGRDGRERERSILKIISNHRDLHAKTAEDWAQIFADRPLTRKTVLCQLIAASRYRGPKHPPRQPLLWMGAAGDRLVDPSCTRELHKRFGGRLVTHPWAGHDLTLDDPDWVIKQVKNAFFKS